MTKREVLMPIELVREIAEIVHKEGYTSLMDVFHDEHVQSSIFLSEEEARDLIDLAVIEKKKARLRFPYYDDEHPRYDEKHEAEFDGVQMGIYEKTIYYVELAFRKGSFDHLLN